MKQLTVLGLPCHVENLNSIAKLEASGFTGHDKSLEISVMEYGLAWREVDPAEYTGTPNESGPHLLFVYATDSIFTRFDRGSIRLDMNADKEWNWADLGAVASHAGMERDEWIALPLPDKIRDMLCYYGSENVFGTDYSGGFTIEL